MIFPKIFIKDTPISKMKFFGIFKNFLKIIQVSIDISLNILKILQQN